MLPADVMQQMSAAEIQFHAAQAHINLNYQNIQECERFLDLHINGFKGLQSVENW